jgi:hypothetical protein
MRQGEMHPRHRTGAGRRVPVAGPGPCDCPCVRCSLDTHCGRGACGHFDSTEDDAVPPALEEP